MHRTTEMSHDPADFTLASETATAPDKGQVGVVGSGDLLACPWCKDTDFDEVGLKLHILNGHCDSYNELSISLPRTRQANVERTREASKPPKPKE